MIFADKAIRLLLENKNPTTFAPALSRNITGCCRAIKRRWHEETEGLEKMKYLAFNLSPCRVPWHYGVSQKTAWKKAAFQSSSPVFCTAKYRGGVRRTEGLKNNIATLL